MNTLTELFAAAGNSRPPNAETLLAAKTFMRHVVRDKDEPKKRFNLAYNSFLNMQMAHMMDDEMLLRQSFGDLRNALGDAEIALHPIS